ncbi:MAG: hypothetical protein FWF77_06965 [Defluviitaleaceae bacterium]|nr:hypothetical protein [Defluviitaleaceae bacterium]
MKQEQLRPTVHAIVNDIPKGYSEGVAFKANGNVDMKLHLWRPMKKRA